MASRTYPIVLESGDVSATTVVLRSRPSPVVAAAVVVITLFASEAPSSNVVIRQPQGITENGPQEPGVAAFMWGFM